MTKFEPSALAIAGIKSSDGGGRHPLRLPELSVNERNPDCISQRLERGEVIVGWFCIELPGNEALDNIFIYRKEYDLLCRYFVVIPKGNTEPVMKIDKIMMFNNQTVADIWDLEMRHYGHIYYDNDGVVAEQRCYVHNVTYEEVRAYLEHESMFLVEEDRFIKQDDQGMQGD